jgi:chemotaxis protein CheD
MKKPPHVLEIVLHPGELWFGNRDTRIRTILGSCVSLTLWHPKHLIGGMCHYMLPRRGGVERGELDGRYADEALDLLLAEIRKTGTRPQEYEAKLFGGGRMYSQPDCGGKKCDVQVQDRNIQAGYDLVLRHELNLKAEHIGGHGHRQLMFDIWSGHAWMKHIPLPSPRQSPLVHTKR